MSNKLNIQIDISKISKAKREFLYWFLYDYEYSKRIGKKCRSCGHIMGKLNSEMMKKGWTSNGCVKFCIHHMDTVSRNMKKKGYEELLLFDLYNALKDIKENPKKYGGSPKP